MTAAGCTCACRAGPTTSGSARNVRHGSPTPQQGIGSASPADSSHPCLTRRCPNEPQPPGYRRLGCNRTRVACLPPSGWQQASRATRSRPLLTIGGLPRRSPHPRAAGGFRVYRTGPCPVGQARVERRHRDRPFLSARGRSRCPQARRQTPSAGVEPARYRRWVGRVRLRLRTRWPTGAVGHLHRPHTQRRNAPVLRCAVRDSAPQHRRWTGTRVGLESRHPRMGWSRRRSRIHCRRTHLRRDQ
jgi:hypothetical protein